MMTCVHF